MSRASLSSGGSPMPSLRRAVLGLLLVLSAATMQLSTVFSLAVPQNVPRGRAAGATVPSEAAPEANGSAHEDTASETNTVPGTVQSRPESASASVTSPPPAEQTRSESAYEQSASKGGLPRLTPPPHSGSGFTEPFPGSYFLCMPPSPPLSDPCMAHLLSEAEASYLRNLKRRGPLPTGHLARKSPQHVRTATGLAFWKKGTLAWGPQLSPSEVVNRMLVPVYPCVLEQRVGVGGEGGKYICRGYMGAAELETEGPSVVSIGSKGQTDFEADVNFLLGGAVSTTFDPFLSREEVSKLRPLQFLRLVEKGLMGSKDLAGQPQNWGKMVNITELLGLINVRESRPGKPKVDIFKIDCEGCEYGVVEDMERLFATGALRKAEPLFGQILMEVHFTRSKSSLVAVLLQRLEMLGYRLFHTEENFVWYNHRWDGFELAFIHESLVRAPEGHSTTRLSPEDTETCFQQWSQRAQAIYAANWRRKSWSLRKEAVPMHMNSAQTLSMMMVSDFPCAQQERLGVWDVGAEWVCLRFRETCGVQAGVAGVRIGGRSGNPEGLAEDLSFEIELASRMHGSVHLFGSPFSTEWSTTTGSLVFHNFTFSHGSQDHMRATGARSGSATVQEIVKLVGAQFIFHLHIDCDGCEYSFVEEMAQVFTKTDVPFGQISMSVHDWSKHMTLNARLQSLGYHQFHAEPIWTNFLAYDLAFIHHRCV